jgi:hypothetical protein
MATSEGRDFLPVVLNGALPRSNLSERSLADSQAAMGYATTRPMDQ